MKILITGNMGYIGPSVVRQFRQSRPKAQLVGFDMGYFAHCLTNAKVLPESGLDFQYIGDIRKIGKAHLKGVDAVVNLAAISNDIMGSINESITLDINYRSGVRLAKLAKAAGVRSFVFASSCSVYGFAEEGAKTEDSSVNPLTAYAKSKILTEKGLKPLASKKFRVTCLRFATACGMSDRLRLDLVLNDFTACAVTSGKITILSDGTPWRPLIHNRDMALAMDWALDRKASEGGDFLVVNAGSNEWNYQVKDLAQAVVGAVPGASVSINKDAPPDKRSYRVSFDQFKKLAPKHQPRMTLEATIQELKSGLEGMKFTDADFRQSQLIRLQVLKKLKDEGCLTENLSWIR